MPRVQCNYTTAQGIVIQIKIVFIKNYRKRVSLSNEDRSLGRTYLLSTNGGRWYSHSICMRWINTVDDPFLRQPAPARYDVINGKSKETNKDNTRYHQTSNATL